MTNPKEHPYADILRAIADGKQIQILKHGHSKWEDVSGQVALSLVYYNTEYAIDENKTIIRIKPKTININGIEVPEPAREPLKEEQQYWFVYIDASRSQGQSRWDDDPIDYTRLDMGIIHLTKEAAETHAKALLSFTKVND